MCIKLEGNEIDTVRGLMTFALNAAIADTLAVELDAVQPECGLQSDLSMNETQRRLLEATIADLFDGIQVEVRADSRVSDLIAAVVDVAFEDLDAPATGEAAA